ncbi:hypothetical protein F511_44058 [Dorcoceras hygrometricum]|uniref:Uncharacterized protein n=1 Tax=Dorcoceras hygrometricum TaxID=472368 RepID=A0A2Z7BWH9_9LAMI|nr:hypothetical protein F511_44058 [Dorcoceras hygrometricum]
MLTDRSPIAHAACHKLLDSREPLMSRVLTVQFFEMKKYVSSILCLLKAPLHFIGHRCHHIASSFNLIVPPLFKRYQLLRADIGRGFDGPRKKQTKPNTQRHQKHKALIPLVGPILN